MQEYRAFDVPPASDRIGMTTHFRDAPRSVSDRERRLTAAVYRLSWALGLALRSPERTTIATGPLVVDLLGDTVAIDGRRVLLTIREWELLAILARYVGQPLGSGLLVDWLWPSGRAHAGRQAVRPTADGHALRWLASRLRRRLGPAGALIKTVVGVGYVLVDRPPELRP